MAFWGSNFIFDGMSCDSFELMMYDFNDNGLSEDNEVSSVSIVEEVVGKQWRPYFYGTKHENKLEFEIVFGVNQDRIDRGQYLSRHEIDEVAAWIAGHDGYKWLEIEQEDMEHVRYRCIVTSLTIVEYGRIPWALKASITCDSKFAYTYPREYSYDIDGSYTIHFMNESSMNSYYKPIILYHPVADGNLEIVNETDGNRIFKFTDLPASTGTLHVDNEHGVIIGDSGINLYPLFNFKFFRLKRGYNVLHVSGKGKLTFVCEFPVSVGG